jgi:hypothetical protein
MFIYYKMSWIDKTQYNPDDICSICHEEYGTTTGIYKTINCNHIFHNDCLYTYCEHNRGDIVCPVCRGDIGDACMDVSAFKEYFLGNSSGGPLFDGNEDILAIYEKNNPAPLPVPPSTRRTRRNRNRRGGKNRRTGKNRKSRTNRREKR